MASPPRVASPPSADLSARALSLGSPSSNLDDPSLDASALNGVSAVRFVLEQLVQWVDEGLLDPPAHRRLKTRLFAEQCPLGAVARNARRPEVLTAIEPSVSPPRPTPQAGQADEARSAVDPGAADRLLDHELNERADALLSVDQPAAHELCEELAIEVAFVEGVAAREVARRERWEKQRKALAVAVEERSSPSSQAAQTELDAAGARTGDDASASIELIEREAADGGSPWLRLIKPFLYQNALWLAGGLLIVFGSLYFLESLWELSSLLWFLSVAVALHGYAAGFFLVGYTLARRREAHAVARILFVFTVALLPLASVATGELVGVLLRRGSGGIVLALLAVALALAAQGGLLALIGGLFERALLAPLTRAGVTLGGLTIAVAPAFALAGSAAGRWVLVLLLPAVAVHALGLRWAVRGRVNLRDSLLLCGGGLTWALIVLLGRLQYGVGLALTHYAPLLAVLALLLLRTDQQLRLRAGEPTRVSALRVGLYGALLSAPLLAFVGLALRGYLDTPARVVVLLSALTATQGFARGAVLHGRRLLTHVAASCGLVAYFFLSAPLKGLLVWAQGTLRGVLGYQNTPLPAAYYGITFLPYLIAVLALAAYLRSRRKDLARDLQHFVGALCVLLVPLSASSSPDLRPMLWTWPGYAVGAIVVSQLFARRWLRIAAQGLMLAWLAVFASWLGAALGSALGVPLIAGYALACAVASGWLAPRLTTSWRHAADLGALGGVALLLPLGVSVGICAELSLALAIGALALMFQAARHRRSGLSLLAAGTVGLAFATMLVAVQASAGTSVAVLLLAAAVAGAIAYVPTRRAAGQPPVDLVVRPALVFALSALAAGLALTAAAAQPWRPIAAGLAILICLQLLLLTSVRGVALVASALAVSAVALFARAFLLAAVGPAIVVAATLLLVAARLLPQSGSATANRELELSTMAHLAGFGGFAGALLWGLQRGDLAALAAGLGAGALFAATAAWSGGRRRSAQAAAILAISGLVAAGYALQFWSSESVLVIFCVASAASLLVRRFGGDPAGSKCYRLLAAPAATVVVLTALGGWLVTADHAADARVSAPIFAAAILLHLAVAHRAAWAQVVGGLALAGAAAQLAAAELGDAQGVFALTVLGPLLLVCARVLPAQWPAAQRRAIALRATAVTVASIALLCCMHFFRAESAPNAGWLALAGGGAALFVLLAAALHREHVGVAVLGTAAGAAALAVASLAAVAWVLPDATLAHYSLALSGASLAWMVVATRLRGCRLRLIAEVSAVSQLGLALVPAVALSVLAVLDCRGLSRVLLIGLAGGSMQLVAGAAALVVALVLAARVRRLAVVPELLPPIAAICLTVSIGTLLLGVSHLSIPLAALALAFALGLVSRDPLRENSRRAGVSPWAVGTALVALVASHGHLGRIEPVIALLAVFGVQLITWRRAPSGGRASSWAVSFVLAAQAATLWIAALVSTGRYPRAAVLAPLAAITLGCGVLLALLARRLRERAVATVAHIATIATLPLVCAALALCQPRVPAFVRIISLVSLAATALFWARAALSDDDCVWQGGLGLTAVTMLYIVSRLFGPLAGVDAGVDALVLVIAGPLALALALAGVAGLGPALRRATVLVPLFAIIVLPRLSPAGAALVSLLIAAHYGVAARSLGNRHLGVPALLFANAALVLAWAVVGWSSALLFVVPVGVTLLAMIHLYESELAPRHRGALRAVVLTGLYGSSVAIACTAVSPLSALTVIPTLCVGGIILGTLLRIRIYLLLGVVFLSIDLAANMLRYGVVSRPLGALFLTGLGLLVVAGMVFFNLEKDRILRRYSHIVSDLRGWD